MLSVPVCRKMMGGPSASKVPFEQVQWEAAAPAREHGGKLADGWDLGAPFQDLRIYICVLTGRQTPASHDDWDTGWFARFPLSVEFQEGAFVNADDKKYWVSQFLHSGFKHPVDYYRNVDANWRDFAADPSMLGRKIEQPTSFICQCLPPRRVCRG